HYTNSRIDCVLFLFAATAQYQTRNPDFFAVHAIDIAGLRTEHVLLASRLRQQRDILQTLVISALQTREFAEFFESRTIGNERSGEFSGFLKVGRALAEI